MNYKLSLAILPAIVILLSMGSCKKKIQCVDGNGDFKMETRQTDTFNRIVTNGAFNITFSQASETRVDVFAESNILPLIQTSVSDQTLLVQVKNDGCYNTPQPVEVTLAAPDLKSVTLSGSETFNGNNLNLDVLNYETDGSATVNSTLDVNELTVSVNGSGNYNLVGSARKGRFGIAGSGMIFSSAFVQDSCEVVISGSGDAHVYVTKYLNVTISGSGSVYYKGNPDKIDSNITGTGELIDEGK